MTVSQVVSSPYSQEGLQVEVTQVLSFSSPLHLTKVLLKNTSLSKCTDTWFALTLGLMVSGSAGVVGIGKRIRLRNRGRAICYTSQYSF